MERSHVYSTPATPVSGATVGVIGGSIAGCAAAIALERLGCIVTILERSSTGLQDRGSGIGVPTPLRDEMVANGYLPTDYPTWAGGGRRWYVADGSPEGQLCWRQPGDMRSNNWGTLWRGLRDHVPDTVRYVDGAEVAELVESDVDVEVALTDGTRHRFDIVVGADGYKSMVRSHLHPDTHPRYAGYVLWRGNFPASRLVDRGAWDEVLETLDWVTVGFDGGHAVMYPIPDFDAATSGELRVNWAIYAPTPDGLVLDGPASIPPGGLTDDVFAQFRQLLADTIPPRFMSLFDSPQSEVSLQPVYDELVDTYTRGRLALIGGAATLSRPHTGSGATKAMQDARLLETLGADHKTWNTLLAAYDADRSATGRTLVELGRRIGRDQVENTPPWAEMSAGDYESWTAGTLSGDTLYFWGDDTDQDL